MLQKTITVGLWLVTAGIAAASQDIADQYPQSPLYSKPVEVIPNVFSAIGATAPPSYENSGHNNNLSFIVTTEGVVVINGGAAAILAKALHDEIKAVTDQPVVMVINENGQGHAMLGNGYWRDLGVDVLNLVIGSTDTPTMREHMAAHGVTAPEGLPTPEEIIPLGLAQLGDGLKPDVPAEDDVCARVGA